MMNRVSTFGLALALAASIGCSRQDAPVPVTDQNLVAPPPVANSTQAPATPATGSNSLGTRTGPEGVRTLDPQPPSRPAARDSLREERSSDVRRSSEPRYVVKKRSKKASAGIILGSAGAGAAIGALAGGSKGAAIGAITGGAAGTIYDRTTAKKRKRLE